MPCPDFRLAVAIGRVAASLHLGRPGRWLGCGVGLFGLGLLPAAAENGVETDNLGVASFVAADSAIYYGVENAGAGVRQVLESGLWENANAEATKELQQILSGEEEASRWAQVFTGDWGLAYSANTMDWLAVNQKISSQTYVSLIGKSLKAQFDLLAGRISTEEYSQALFGSSTEDSQELIRNLVRQLPGTDLPGLVVVVRPGTESARNFLAQQVEEFVGQFATQLPPSVQAGEGQVGAFASRTWSAKVVDVARDAGADTSQFVEMANQEWGLNPKEAADLALWLEQRTLVVGYGWSQDGSTFSLFFGPSAEQVPVARDGSSLLNTEPGLAELAATTPANTARLDIYASEAASAANLDGFWENFIAPIQAKVSEVVAENPTDARAKLVGQVSTSLGNTLQSVMPEVSGATISSAFFDGGLRLESLTGTKEKGLELNQPIRYTAALESDAPLVMVGAVNPANYDQGLQFIADFVRLGAVTEELSREVNQKLAADALNADGDTDAKLTGKAAVLGQAEADAVTEAVEEEAVAELEEETPYERGLAAGSEFAGSELGPWLRTPAGEQALSAVDRLGDRLSQALGQQTVIVADFGGKVPKGLSEQAAEANLPGMPRVSWMADVIHPEALDGAWPEFVASANLLLSQNAQLAAQGVPSQLPLPVDVEQAGVKSWFYSFGDYTNFDFLPVLSRSGKQLILGSSVNLHRDLAALAEEEPGLDKAALVDPQTLGTPEEAGLTGRYTRIRFGEVLRNALDEAETRRLVEDLAEQVDQAPNPQTDLLGLSDSGETAGELLEALREHLGDFTYWERAEGDRVRHTLTVEFKD